ncbi:Negative elongation factor A [Microtus ochrogaster]|uniref:Negative elongation factor A n=1 Tax=Microtus ochrogaster TaxID=79684 RepID=A0A8J6GSV4_MICOH|nr:Negative elongation factor A [Microtus ochrogaster]
MLLSLEHFDHTRMLPTTSLPGSHLGAAMMLYGNPQASSLRLIAHSLAPREASGGRGRPPLRLSELEAPPRAHGRRHVGGPRWGHVVVRVRCRLARASAAKMASMRESDTGLWLHNKLGATDELWAPPSIASLLTAAVIDNIRLCFHRLSSAVKLKLLLGTLHLPRRTVDEMKGALMDIIQLATLDSDPWVLMVADILKSFPDTGSLNLDLEEQNPNVQDILGELREKVGECEASAMLPLECQYLNKNALTTLAGPLTPPVKHFQLKRKPKSATLRAELLQKSTETAQQLKRSAGVPFHAKGRGLLRKMDTTNTEVVEKPTKEETVVENATPDYAAGLVSTQKLGSLNSEPALPSTSYLPSTPSVVPASSYIPSSETPPAPPSREASRPPEEPNAPSPTLPAQFKQRAPMYNSGLSPATPTPATPTSPLTPTTPPAATPTAQTPPVAMVAPQTQAPAPAPVQQQPKKNLSLTREQMFAAQEMFKTANKVTRPEKALILGFMAGSRENPCPEQGDVIQIKLSEHTEDLPKADGQGSTTMLVDTVFEMNYATGQWTRFKKYKPMTNVS